MKANQNYNKEIPEIIKMTDQDIISSSDADTFMEIKGNPSLSESEKQNMYKDIYQKNENYPNKK